MKRRKFIKQTGMLLPAAMMPVPNFGFNSRRKYKMGLQLYTVRDAMDADPVGTLQKVRAMGYEDLELYGFDGEKEEYYGYSAKDFKQILNDAGLTTSSCHYGLPAFFDQPEAYLMAYVEKCIKGAHILGQRYITWPWLDPKFRNIESYKKLAGMLNRIGERVLAGGLGFAYHNHGFEFEDHKGEVGYDIIITETDPVLVKLQLDLYWVAHDSALSANDWFALQPGRFVMLHIKDMHKESRDYTELGNGSINFHPILPEAEKAGLEYYYLEQGSNFAVNSMQSIADSAAYFKKYLKKYL